MTRLRPSQLVLSAAVLALYAPVLLVVGDARFRGAWLTESVGPFPVSVWIIGGLMMVLIALAWVFAGSAFDTPDDNTRSDRP